MAEVKLCTKCKKLKSRSEFSKNRRNKDGLRYLCKKCESKYKRRYYRRIKRHAKKYFRYEERHQTFDGVKQKRCSKCNKWKDESEFSIQRSRKDGLSFWCKKCENEYSHRYYRQNRKGREKYRKYDEFHRVVEGIKQKQCNKCKRWKPETEFHKMRTSRDGLCMYCKVCANKDGRKYRERQKAVLK